MTWGPQVHSWRLGVCLGTEDQLPTRMQACPNSSEPYSLQLLCGSPRGVLSCFVDRRLHPRPVTLGRDSGAGTVFSVIPRLING